MDNRDRPDAGAEAFQGLSLAAAVGEVFESFVSAAVERPAERLAQARTIATLILTAFLCAALAAVSAFVGAGLAYSLLPVTLGGVLLAAATLLSGTGRLETTILVLFWPSAAAVGAAAAAFGAPWLAAAALLGPLEAWLSGRGRMAWRMLPAAVATMVLAAGLTMGLAWETVPSAAALALTAFAGLAAATRLAVAASRIRAGRLICDEERNAEAEAVARLCPQMLLRLDPAGILLDASPAAVPLFGRVAGERLVETLHLRDRLAFLTAFDTLRGGADEAACRVRVLTEEGEHEVALLLAALRAGDGTLRRVLAAVEERGELVEAERRLSSEVVRAEAASKAKSQLLAAVSHELRTPLNAIIGFTDILEQEFFGGFETPRQKEYVGLIQTSGQHLLHLVNGLLDIAKIEAGRYELSPERFAIAEAVRDAAEMVRGEAERKGLDLRLPASGDEPQFVADRAACKQILLNLLSNAVKFTERGTISVSVSIEDGRQIVRVADSGIGIAPDDLPRIAEPFVQLESGRGEGRKGTGLGLSLVKGLCELHGGSIEIASRPDVGTIVTATIPADCAERLDPTGNVNQNVVTLNDARRKAPVTPSRRPNRRSA